MKKIYILLCWLFYTTTTIAVENLPDFTGLVEENSPSIVNISTIKKNKVDNKKHPKLEDNEELNDFLEKFFGDKPFDIPDKAPPRSMQSLGSGFIYSSDGYVVTNYHVIKDSDQIIVKLNDKRELEAKIVGTDPSSDIALLKIEADNLRAVKLGSSEKLKVGQWVLAIGSPFGFESTVTAGIVSAKGRSLPNDNYVPFIQTDVAINPGNSGGPLFDLDGKVVGINAQIFSRSGGFMGLSFAIPIDVAVNVITQLKTNGKVTRGWIGVYIQEVTSNLAKSFGMDKPKGALISKIISDGPASNSDLKIGDIILKFDGNEINTSSELPPVVGRSRPGENVPIIILRDGKKKLIKFKVGELPSKAPEIIAKKEESVQGTDILGMTITNLKTSTCKKLKVDCNIFKKLDYKGVYVSNVKSNPALGASILKGDIVVQVAGVNIKNIKTFKSVVKRLNKGNFASLYVKRPSPNSELQSVYLAIKIE